MNEPFLNFWAMRPDSLPAPLLIAIAFIYLASVAVFLVMDNRNPQSTIAWLLVMWLLPGIGLVAYMLTGRSWQSFDKSNKVEDIVTDFKLIKYGEALFNKQPELIGSLGQNKQYERLAQLLWATATAPITIKNEVDILQNAEQKYKQLIEDIKNSKKFIHMVYYQWAVDDFTNELSELLVSKVKEGVEVRILYDATGSLPMHTVHRGYLREMRKSGISITAYSPLYKLISISYRCHRKIVVIDNNIGYNGGMNIGESQIKGPEGFSGWRDTQVRVKGESVSVLNAVFAAMWLEASSENIFKEDYFKPNEITQNHLPMQMVSSGPDSKWRAIRKSYFEMISLARDHIYIQTPYLVLDQTISEALKSAALSGVKVKIMIAPNGPEGFVYRAGKTYTHELAKSGVEIYQYRGAYMHAKTVSIDSSFCSIGSANMDIRSFSISYETNTVIYDANKTLELEASFNKDLEKCDLFSVEEYDNKPFHSRLADSCARLVSPIL